MTGTTIAVPAIIAPAPDAGIIGIPMAPPLPVVIDAPGIVIIVMGVIIGAGITTMGVGIFGMVGWVMAPAGRGSSGG